MNYAKILKLRKELHQNPELSGDEYNTARLIRDFIGTHHPTRIIEKVSGQGLMAVYEFANPGPTIVIRCEMDSLPIAEENNFAHRSTVGGISHKCGHDGHMAIVAGLVFWIRAQNFSSGKIVLLFQPAEESGEGAFKVLQDERFINLHPDYIYALHNIPGEPLHTIITTKTGFSAEVESFSITLTGKESHAAEPEQGINPSPGISEIIKALSGLNVPEPERSDFAILTAIHIHMGEKAYGISPGKGEMHYTIRTWDEDAMNSLKKEITGCLKRICNSYKLDYKITWFEHFPATINDPDCTTYISQAISTNQLEVLERQYPFKFGEDFGWFSRNFKTAMFGVGAGVNSPALHHADYDFPDEIIETGITMFASIIQGILEK